MQNDGSVAAAEGAGPGSPSAVARSPNPVPERSRDGTPPDSGGNSRRESSVGAAEHKAAAVAMQSNPMVERPPRRLQNHPDLEMDLSEQDKRQLMRRGSVVDRYRRASVVQDLLNMQLEEAEDEESREVLRRLRAMQTQGGRFGSSAQQKVFAFEVVAGGEEAEVAINPFCVAALPDDLRRGFLRKVFGIVGVQLVLMMGIMCFILFTPAVRDAVEDAPGAAVGVLLAPLFILGCLFSVRKRYPYNMIFFSIFSSCFAYGLAAVCIFLDSYFFLFTTLAVGSNALIIAGLTYALPVSKLTIARGLPWTTLANIAIAVVARLVLGDKLTAGAAVGCAFVTTLFAAWLLFDMGAIQVDLTADEYMTGAIDLYLDILSMFVWMVVCCFYCTAQAAAEGGV